MVGWSRLRTCRPRARTRNARRTTRPTWTGATRLSVYWGDQHLHTSFSADAGLVGDRLGPDDAFRFARGEQLRSSTGQLAQLERPYDWLVVSDHAEYIGLSQAFADGDPAILDTPRARGGPKPSRKAARPATTPSSQMTEGFRDGKPSIPPEALAS